jgi:hypothetical protein
LSANERELADRVRSEIEAVHAFISSWFRGELPQSDGLFDEEFAARMGAQLINIQPSGRALARSELIASIRRGYGANPSFRITISDCEVRSACDAERLVLATYTELQQGARNTTPPDNTRVSTVLLELPRKDGRATWLHIHETRRPD